MCLQMLLVGKNHGYQTTMGIFFELFFSPSVLKRHEANLEVKLANLKLSWNIFTCGIVLQHSCTLYTCPYCLIFVLCFE